MPTHGELAEALAVVSDTFGSVTVRHGELAAAKLSTATATRHGELAEVSLAATTTLLINPISDVKTPPLEVCTVTATLNSGEAADSWTFTQTGGPLTTLNQTGNVCTFLAPPSVEGTTVLIAVDATKGGIPASTILARFLVYPQQTWKLLDATLAAVYGGVPGWVAYKSTRIP